MSNLGWTIEEDKFEQDTVIGNVEFSNVIATLDPNAPRRMVIACMYIFNQLVLLANTFRLLKVHSHLFCF